MRLTVHTDYALRVLMFLAVNPDKLVTVNEIAVRYDISKNHLMKVAQTLSKIGVIKSTRGRAGGLALNKNSDDVNIGDLVQELERKSPLAECFPGGENSCILSNCCNLRSALAKAEQAFFASLRETSLSDLVQKNHDLLLRLESA
jgi:Rrf2 family transcriptional regulator, nitric oxide-sensitive transcriptional repressor